MKRTLQNLWTAAKVVIMRKVYSYTDLPQEAGKIPNKQSKFIPKETRKRGTNKIQSKEKEGNNKDLSGNK